MPRTACGFCDNGVLRGQPCPYCKGTGDAPTTDANCTKPTHVHTNDDGSPLVCPDCGQPTFYDYADEQYHHVTPPAATQPCFLAGKDTASDHDHP